MQFFKLFFKKTVIQSAFLLVILLISGTAVSRMSINRANLLNERNNQQNKAGLDTTPLGDVVTSKKPNKYTQTEAFLSLPHMRDLIEKQYGSKGKIAPFLNIIATVIANEKQYAETHYAFYHTTPNSYRVTQDIFTQLYAAVYGKKVNSDFKFLRFDEAASVNATVQNWLIDELQNKGLVNDNIDELAAILLSVNLSLFANVGFNGECTWDYFIKDHGHREPKREMYEGMMERFGFSNKYVDELMSLAAIYETPEDTILQVMVPKDLVDQIGYLAWVMGVPANEDVIEHIKKTAGGKSFLKHRKPTIIKLMEKFEKEGEKNRIYKDMLASVKAGDFSLESYLKAYCNKPWELENINDVTARLLFTPDVLLNPDSGVKFFRYASATRKQMKEYQKRLNEVIDKILAEKQDSSSDTETNKKDWTEPLSKPLSTFGITPAGA